LDKCCHISVVVKYISKISTFMNSWDVKLKVRVIFSKIIHKIAVPDKEAGRCLGPEGNGVSLGEGGEGGPGLQEVGKISSQCSARAGTTWARTRRTRQVGCDEEGSAQTE
jgi:hypothetical protein